MKAVETPGGVCRLELQMLIIYSTGCRDSSQLLIIDQDLCTPARLPITDAKGACMPRYEQEFGSVTTAHACADT